MKGCLVVSNRRGGEARKRQCLLIGSRSSIRNNTHRQEHYWLAVAGKNRSSFPSQGDWRRRADAPSRRAVLRCCSRWSDKTNTPLRSERLSVLGRNDSPSENREQNPVHDRSAECRCRRTPHYR